MKDKPKIRKCIKLLCGLLRDRRTQEEQEEDPTTPETSGTYNDTRGMSSGKIRWIDYNVTINKKLRVELRCTTGRAKDVVMWIDHREVELRPQEQERLHRDIQVRTDWLRKRLQRRIMSTLATALTTPKTKDEPKPEPAKEPA